MWRTALARVVLTAVGLAVLPIGDPSAHQTQSIQPQRVALVIGNNKYARGPLQNAVNDARAMGHVLSTMGFAVKPVLDATQSQLAREIEDFVRRIPAGAVALVFYAGHGVQINGDNLLLPVDFSATTELEAQSRSYSASELFDRLSTSRAGTRILILDACRDNPYRPVRAVTRGLAPMSQQARKGSGLIVFSTSPGDVAEDRSKTPNSLFTAELLKVIEEPGLTLDQVFTKVTRRVNAASNGLQRPWINASLLEDFFFKPTNSSAPATFDAFDARMWDMVSEIGSPEMLRWFMESYPKSVYATQAAFRLNNRLVVEATPGSQVRPAITLTPFRQIGTREDLGWFATALDEFLATELSAGDHLLVSRESRSASPQSPDYLIRGTYLAAAGDPLVRIDVVVSRRDTEVRRLSETAAPSAVRDLIDRLGKTIREALGLTAPTQSQVREIAGASPATAEGARIYSQALAKLAAFDGAAARDLLTQLTGLEPRFALGHAKLADAWSLLGFDVRAREAIDVAVGNLAGLPRPLQMQVNAQYFRITGDVRAAANTMAALVAYFPDNLEFVLQLAELELVVVPPAAVLKRVGSIRQAFTSSADDPALLLIEASALHRSGDFKGAAALAADTARRASQAGAHQLAARARLAEARAHQRMNNLKEGATANEEARRLFARAGDQSGYVSVLIQTGAERRAQQQYTEAESLLTEAMEIAKSIGSRQRLGGALTNLGLVRQDQHRDAEAVELFNDAVACYREIQADAFLARALNNLAISLMNVGRTEEGILADREALEIKRKLGDPASVAVSLGNLGESLVSQMRLGEAVTLYEEARALFDKQGDAGGVAWMDYDLAVVRFWQGLLSDSRALADRALAAQVKAEVNGVLTAQALKELVDTELLLSRLDVFEARCKPALGRLDVVLGRAKLDVDTRVKARALRVEALVCDRQIELAIKESTQIGESPSAVAMIAAGTALAVAHVARGAVDEGVQAAEQARALAQKSSHRLLQLDASVLIEELRSRRGPADAGRLQDLQRTAAAAGIGLAVQRLERLKRAY